MDLGEQRLSEQGWHEQLWKAHLCRLGEFIRSLRQSNQLTQRELAEASALSDTYMSQLERGLHEPSIRVLKALAESLGIRPDQLIMYAAGLPLDETSIPVEEAIRMDPRFTGAQKKALLAIAQSYLADDSD